jgi:hypothetical protein
VQWSKGNQVLDLLEHFVIDDCRIGEIWAAVHDSVADRTNSNCVKINASISKIFCHRLHSGGMISNRTAGLADPLHNSSGLYLGGLRHHKLVLQRRRASIQH